MSFKACLPLQISSCDSVGENTPFVWPVFHQAVALQALTIPDLFNIIFFRHYFLVKPKPRQVQLSFIDLGRFLELILLSSCFYALAYVINDVTG